MAGDAFADIDCPAVTAAAAGLDEQRLTAVEELMELRLAAGETGSLVAELSALTSGHPLRDALRGSLMLALYRSGRQADALAVYDEGRRLLADELGLEPGPRLRRLQTEILADAPRCSAVRPRPSGPSPSARAGTTTCPATCPTSPAAPTSWPGSTGPSTDRAAAPPYGRDRRHGRHRQDGARRPLRAPAHRGPPRRPVLRGSARLQPGARAPHPEQALGVLLRSDGVVPDTLPAGLAERSAIWRSRLAGRSALLVLDNVADAAQVAPLLPGAGDSLALITTRRKLTATDGALSLPLGALAPAEAETLFRRIAGDACAGSPLTGTVALCGHHPLALRIAATRLRDRPSWTVPDVTARLSTSAGRTAFLRTADRDLMSVLALSYAHLPHEALEFIRTLAHHPAAVHDIARTCTTTGLAPAAVEYLFDTLLDHNLADEPTPSHLAIPLLLQDCAHTTAPPARDTTPT